MHVRNITIVPVLNGFICQVGCQQVVFTNVSNLLEQLDAYLRHPESTTAAMLETACNAKMFERQVRSDLVENQLTTGQNVQPTPPQSGSMGAGSLGGADQYNPNVTLSRDPRGQGVPYKMQQLP